LEVEVAPRSHTLTHCDEERKKIVVFGKAEMDIDVDLKNKGIEIVFAVL
jgi:hypothetical protein